MSQFGLVASGHPLATQAGQEVLEKGGNAFDATVAGGFAQTVVEPLLCSLGGGGYMVTFEVGRGAYQAYDFFVDFPGRGVGLDPRATPLEVDFMGAKQHFKIGEGSVTAPGILEGFLEIHKRLGVLSLGDVLAPAIRFAGDGHKINKAQGDALIILQNICKFSEKGRSLYLSLIHI